MIKKFIQLEIQIEKMYNAITMLKQLNIKLNIDDSFFPYENLIPIFYGITSKEQEKVIEPEADGNYLLKNPKGEHEVIISI